MALALMEPPQTTQELRDRADELVGEVEGRLEHPGGKAQEFFVEIRGRVLAIARSPAWRAHDLARELLVLLEDLRDAIEADPEGHDPQWRLRELLQRMAVVLHAMLRQLSHDAIDRPETAAQFVATRLADVEVGKVAALLGTSPRMVTNYRKGEVGQLRKDPDRITLVGQLVHELQYSMTPRGVLLWFDAPMEALGGATPRALLDADPAANRAALMAVARGGRGQLDADVRVDGQLVSAA